MKISKIKELNEKELYQLYRRTVPRDYGEDLVKYGSRYYGYEDRAGYKANKRNKEFCKQEAKNIMIAELTDYIEYVLGYTEVK